MKIIRARKLAGPNYVNALFFLFPIAPELGHILERLALGLRNELPYEDGSDNADDAIETISEPVAEVITLRKMHVEHRHEG